MINGRLRHHNRALSRQIVPTVGGCWTLVSAARKVEARFPLLMRLTRQSTGPKTAPYTALIVKKYWEPAGVRYRALWNWDRQIQYRR